MTFLGRASMMAFVFMTASYFVSGQIIPGVAWVYRNNIYTIKFEIVAEVISKEKSQKN